MRKLVLSAALLLASSAALFAQKLKDAEERMAKGKYDEARQKIDQYLQDPKNQNDANAWYRKGQIYTQLSLDSTLKDTNTDYRTQAFSAFQKYYDMDSKNVLGTVEQNVRLFQLYEGNYNDAIKAYNNNNFAKSFQNFSRALALEEYIRQKGFTYGGINFPAIDTNLILNTAAAALKAQMEDSAMSYYRRLADAKLNQDNYIEIYQMLVDYYGRKGDTQNQQKYLALGRELYPKSDYWYEAELSPLKEDKPKLFDKYKELTAANPSSYYLNYNYAVELFNYLYANDEKPADAATFEPQVAPAIDNAIKANNTPDANLLMVRMLSEQIYRKEDQARAVKGTTAADAAKRKAAYAEVNQLWDKMAPYADAAFQGYTTKTELKGYEKGNLKFVSNVLVDYYNMKKQADKAKSYQDKIKEFGL